MGTVIDLETFRALRSRRGHARAVEAATYPDVDRLPDLLEQYALRLRTYTHQTESLRDWGASRDLNSDQVLLIAGFPGCIAESADHTVRQDVQVQDLDGDQRTAHPFTRSSRIIGDSEHRSD